MKQQKWQSVLSSYVPEKATSLVLQWICAYQIALTITAKRKTVRGNYRAPYAGQGHQIRINGDLNPYAFLVTFVHEMAHLKTWEKHRSKVKPHGSEWKQEFKALMQPFLKEQVFPPEIATALHKYLENPAASSCRDENLMRLLRSYDVQTTITLEEIPLQSLFRIEDGRTFRKEERLRKNFRCIEVSSKQAFRISALMPVIPVMAE